MSDRAYRILVVDDEPDALRIITHVLNRASYVAVPAYGGEHALRKLEKDRFDLVLTDLAMPGVSGVSVINRVRSDPQMRGIPVVAITAHIWDEISQSARQIGCDGFIAKPVSPKELLREVNRYLTEWHAPRATA
jgi:CheY-like chemotaxis protein